MEGALLYETSKRRQARASDRPYIITVGKKAEKVQTDWGQLSCWQRVRKEKPFCGDASKRVYSKWVPVRERMEEKQERGRRH